MFHESRAIPAHHVPGETKLVWDLRKEKEEPAEGKKRARTVMVHVDGRIKPAYYPDGEVHE